MSIVLVIVGLVVGGIFIFGSMRETFQARKLMTQMESYQSAVNTFKLKYNCIAGDCARASQFNLGTSGNVDGFIGPTTNIYTSLGGCLGGVGCATTTETTAWGAAGIQPIWGEFQWFWVHLMNAGLTNDKLSVLSSAETDIAMNDYFPRDAVGKANLIAFMWNSKLYIRTGFTRYPPAASATMPASAAAPFTESVLNSSQMYYIHSKFDASVSIDITSASGPYPLAMRSGHRVLPLNMCVDELGCFNGYRTNIWVAPVASWGQWNVAAWNAQCALPNSAGVNVYNVANNGACNFLWRLDY